MRQALAEMNYRKMERLEVNDPNLVNLFQFLHELLYKSKDFNWKSFKEQAIVKDKLDDFKAKAAALDFGEFTEAQLKEVETIRSNTWLKDFIEKDPKAEPLLELFDYLDYIPACVSTQKEIIVLLFLFIFL